ncbi:hypothetical protein ACN68I_06420 [Aerococcus viridans]|uniref:hypothetical protein n=1 Tax=Aerococcus viridans TaxID=1377 RepID=UPI003B221344
MTLKQYILLSQMEYATTSFFSGFMGILYAWYNYGTFRLGFSILGLLTVVIFYLAIGIRDTYLDYDITDHKNTDSPQEVMVGKESIPLKNIRLAYYLTGGVALAIGLFLVLQTSLILFYIGFGGMLIGFSIPSALSPSRARHSVISSSGWPWALEFLQPCFALC